MKIQKVNRKRIYEDIAEQLEEILLNSELKPGEKFYSENELAAMFDVSRTTIRQALTILEIKGLIERRQGSATYLAEQKQPEETKGSSLKVDNEILVTNMVQIMSAIPKNILSEPLELRKIIEPNIASLAAKRATEEDIKNIEDCIKKQAEVIRQNKISVNEDSAIHFAIAKAANNSMMLILVETLHELLYNSRYQSHLGGGSESSVEDHLKILEAIKNKDASRAYDLMMEHLLHTEHQILLNVDSNFSKDISKKGTDTANTEAVSEERNNQRGENKTQTQK